MLQIETNLRNRPKSTTLYEVAFFIVTTSKETSLNKLKKLFSICHGREAENIKELQDWTKQENFQFWAESQIRNNRKRFFELSTIWKEINLHKYFPLH